VDLGGFNYYYLEKVDYKTERKDYLLIVVQCYELCNLYHKLN